MSGVDEFLKDLVDIHAEEVIDDMTRVTQEETPEDVEMEDEDITEAEVIDSWHVQVRLEEPGPVKGDGRRGRILLEDTAAPTEVVRWLMSPRCCKADRSTGRPIYVWVNDEMLGNESVSIPDADSSVRASPPAHLAPADTASIRLLSAYQTRLEGQIETLEAELERTRRRCEEEASAARQARDKEVSICAALVEQARLRVQKELQREDQEIESINQRRVVIGNQRADMAGDLQSFSHAMETIKTQIQEARGDDEPSLVDRVSDVIKLANDEGIQEGLGNLFRLYMTAKSQG
jgi:hypothetical protein